jgi:LysM repeat protein
MESRDAHEPRTAAELFGPAWEQPRRFEAYPNLRTRIGLPSFAGVPPVAVASLALVAAAMVLFFVGPMLLGIGGKDKGSASPSPIATVAATPTPLPTEPPGPTATVYTVVKNDTVLKIAAKFGITVEQLLAANPKIKNPDKIKIGDQLVIPVPIATEIQGVEGASAAP